MVIDVSEAADKLAQTDRHASTLSSTSDIPSLRTRPKSLSRYLDNMH
jgi:hypothetical protein